MLLPPSLGLFVQQLGARPYTSEGMTQLEPFTDNVPLDSTSFGLSAIHTSDGVIKITIGQRDPLQLSSVTSAGLGLYRVHVESRLDTLVKTIAIDLEMVFDNHLDVTQRVDDPEDLVVACVLTSGSNTYSSWVPVEIDGHRDITTIMNFIQPQAEFDSPRWETPRTEVLQVTEDGHESKIDLDFSKPGDPRIDCLGELTYSGGGSRYLSDNSGSPLLQSVNKAPWDLDCHAFVEPEATQLYAGYLLTSASKWKYSQDFNVIESTQDSNVISDGKQLNYVVQAPKVNDSDWEWVTERSTWVANKTTFSLYFSTTSRSKIISFLIGIRIYTSAGVLQREVTQLVADRNDFNLKSVTLIPIESDTNGYVEAFIRVAHLHYGERAVLSFTAPQLEYNGSATSRCIGQRAQDQITYVPSLVSYQTDHGVFRISLYLGYTGIPTNLGEQWLFDTRSSSGDNGWYLVHRHDGILEFGFSGPDGGSTHFVQSASVMQLDSTLHEITCWYGDFGLCLDLNNTRIGTNSMLLPETPDLLSVVRIGRDFTEAKSMTGEIVKFAYDTLGDTVD